MSADAEKSAGPPSAVAVRVVLDDQGRYWRVYERIRPHYDRRRTAALVFERADVVRVVREFPPDWREQSDASLYQLSLRF